MEIREQQTRQNFFSAAAGPAQTASGPSNGNASVSQWQQWQDGPLDATVELSASARSGRVSDRLQQALLSKGLDSSTFEGLSQADQDREAWLIQREQDVTEHEEAHENSAAGGGVLTQGAAYGYTTGASGRQYRTSGHVMIDTSSTGDPEEDRRRGQAIVAAAMAPSGLGSAGASELSDADLSVAAQGRQMMAEADSKSFSSGKF